MSYTNITVDNRDTAYTIDTYAIFTADNTFESEAEYLVDEYKLDINAIDFDFDHKGYVQALAEASVELLERELIGDVVKGITLIKSQSPRFYNYTTDSYTALWCINKSALERYIEANQGQYNLFEQENWRGVYMSHGTEDFKPDDYLVAMLDYYTRQMLDDEAYESAMYEYEHNLAYEYIKPDEATQKLIDNVLNEREQ